MKSEKFAAVLAEQAKLRERLSFLVSSYKKPHLSNQPLNSADVIITPNEVNDKHGTGILIKRIFSESSNIISIRSMNTYDGEHDFGTLSLCISHKNLSRFESFQTIIQSLQNITINRIVCVPLRSDDVMTAIAIKELFDAPLCTYILDDQNIHINGISDALMRELLTKSSLRLAISPEMRDAYETKYRLNFWQLPAVVDRHLIQTRPVLPDLSKNGVMIGNVWSEYWFDLLQQTLNELGIQIDWYKNNEFKWLAKRRSSLAQSGLNECDYIEDEAEFVTRLRQYTYAVIPSGTLDNHDPYRSVGYLSLPSRIPQLLSTANLPMIVLGSRKTAAARFVERFNIGIVCDYNTLSFKEAVEQITDPATQQTMRQNAAAIAPTFADTGIAEWIWQSLERGQPCDDRFEALLHRTPADLTFFIEPPHPGDIFADFVPVYQAFRRLKWRGFRPDFIVDVGASVGVWSYTINKLFPDARFLLIDPLISKYDAGSRNHFSGQFSNFELIEVAISNTSGTSSLQVSPDLYGSSLLNPADFRSYETVEIEVKTLDQLASEMALQGRGVLKIDVQCAEHLVLEGAAHLLEQIDVLVVELSLVRYDEQAKILPEMLSVIDRLGFHYFDDAGEWRSPVDGSLLQKDILFVRESLATTEASRPVSESSLQPNADRPLVPISSGLPDYYNAKPMYDKLCEELIEEVQRIHRYYLEFQMKYAQSVGDELLKMQRSIAELNRKIGN
jgi:FkbM family methyltransferase